MNGRVNNSPVKQVTFKAIQDYAKFTSSEAKQYIDIKRPYQSTSAKFCFIEPRRHQITYFQIYDLTKPSKPHQ